MNILTSEHDPDIILITESWCNPDITDAMLKVTNYTLETELRKDRTDTHNGIGGGLLVYSKNGIKVKPCEARNPNNFNQYCYFQVLGKKQAETLDLCLIYRSPNSTEENTDNLCKLIQNNPKCNFIGDFNLPDIDWLNKTSGRKGRKLLETTEDNFMEQAINFPTHVRGNTLDLCLTNCPQNILNVTSLGNLGNSDHTIIQIDFSFSANFIKTDEMVRDWGRGDIDGLKNFLDTQDWEAKLRNKTTDEAWSEFTTIVNQGMEDFIPLTKRRRPCDPPWMTRLVKRICNKKQRHWRTYINYRTPENFNRYKKTENEAKKIVRNAKKRYEKKIAFGNNKKKFDSYVKNKTKNRHGIGPLKHNNITVTDDAEMATLLNNFFSSVFTREDTNNVPTMPILPCNSVLNSIRFEVSDVEKKIDNLKLTSSSGPDNISSKLLQTSTKSMATALTIIYNKSISSGCVPKSWREANVTPIFKKGSKGAVENHRPVSLTSIPCRIMESIMRDEIVEHLLNNSLINESQHGFLKNKSCATNLLEFLEAITSEADNGSPIDIIYLDFSKAFDKVPKLRLMEKLAAHSISGKVFNWIKNWLSDRTQRTVLNGKQSDWSDVWSGVPQGSVLGPVLFLIFINDLDFIRHLITVLKKFADDTKLGQKILNDSDRQNLQDCLDMLYDWANKWGMQFNVSKCKILHTGRSNPKHTYTMNNIPLTVVEEEKDIGVIVHNSLKPSRQCSEAARKANAVLGQISRSFHYRDRNVFLKLYKSHVRSHLEFSVTAWSPWSEADKTILENVQKRAVRMISGLSGSYEENLKTLNLQSLEDRRIRYDLIQTYKIINEIDAVKPSTWFNLVGENQTRQTRFTINPINILPGRSRLEIRRNFFSQRVPELWNNLPDVIKNSRTVAIFKRELSKHMKNL